MMFAPKLSIKSTWICFVLSVVFFTETLAAFAQTAPRSETRATTVLMESDRGLVGFTHIVAVRELSDGRVLITDGPSQTLAILDDRLRTMRQLGRTGDGPGEYRNPGAIYPVGQDSSVLYDGPGRRWLLLINDRFVALSENLSVLRNGIRGELAGVSSRVALDRVGVGAVRRTPFPGSRGRPEGHERVAILLRRPGPTVDTLALGQTRFFGFAQKRGKSLVFNALHPLQSSDQAVLFLDGRIAIAFMEPYSIEWRSGSGQRLVRTVSTERMPTLTVEQRREITRGYVREADGAAVFTETDFSDWPDRAPPFTSRSLVAGLDGRVYVSRTSMGPSRPRRIDVFSMEHGFEGAFELPPRERLLAVGVRGVYVARLNEDDEEVLVRYRPAVFGR